MYTKTQRQTDRHTWKTNSLTGRVKVWHRQTDSSARQEDIQIETEIPKRPTDEQTDRQTDRKRKGWWSFPVCSRRSPLVFGPALPGRKRWDGQAPTYIIHLYLYIIYIRPLRICRSRYPGRRRAQIYCRLKGGYIYIGTYWALGPKDTRALEPPDSRNHFSLSAAWI